MAWLSTMEGGCILPTTYRTKDPEQQKKIEELAQIREAYRHQRRIWLWMMCLSLVSSAILFHRTSTMSALFGLLCLGIGIYLVWNFWKCSRAIRMIDQGLSPYRAKEGRVKR